MGLWVKTLYQNHMQVDTMFYLQDSCSCMGSGTEAGSDSGMVPIIDRGMRGSLSLLEALCTEILLSS